jgi:hypothetical protein
MSYQQDTEEQRMTYGDRVVGRKFEYRNICKVLITQALGRIRIQDATTMGSQRKK